MRSWIALLACLLAVGCDDETVREHIIDNFVCTYMPWWMGDCQGEEVVNKVMGVLDHGLVEAEVSCEGTYVRVQAGANACGTTDLQPFSYRAQRLIDGACLVNRDLLARGRPGADDCSGEYQAGAGRPHFALSVGDLVITSDLDSLAYDPFGFQCHVAPTPPTVLDISASCTGFNLEAFE